VTSTAVQPSLHKANEDTVTELRAPQADGLCGATGLGHPVPHRVLHTVVAASEGPGR